MIIDESDGEIDSFPRARALGYDGVSSKACKGFYKSVINRARCEKWNAEGGTRRYFMSAEDLTVHAGVSLQQDLALVNYIGLTHVERNGHHFVDGFCERPDSEADAFLAAHTHKASTSLFDILQPAWAGLYSGAIHPTAEAHAIVADHVVRHVRAVVDKSESKAGVVEGRAQ